MFWTDPYVIPIETGNHLYDWTEKFGNLLAGYKTLLLIDDIINVIPIETGNHLYDWTEKFGNLLAGYKTLFLIDDIIGDKTLNKKRQFLLGLATSGRHKGHSLWLLMQSYTAIPLNIRRQAKMLYIWYPKK